MLINPPSAWTSRSYPGSSAPAPPPKPVMEQKMRPGLSAPTVS